MTEYRVWNVVNPPNYPVFIPVASPEEAIGTINHLANVQLAIPTISANAFGLESLDDDGEWSEWYHPEHGCDIDEYAAILEGGA